MTTFLLNFKNFIKKSKLFSQKESHCSLLAIIIKTISENTKKYRNVSSETLKLSPGSLLNQVTRGGILTQSTPFTPSPCALSGT